MKSVSINGIARVNLGKSFAKKLRNEENVPCVIYGGNESPIHFYAHSNEFRKIVYTADVFLIDVNVGDETVRTVMGDIQFHPPVVGISQGNTHMKGPGGDFENHPSNLSTSTTWKF